MANKFYVTTPIYYVNDVPHIGHAYTTLAADVLARYHRQKGGDVFFLTGTDEHGAKVAQAAKEAGKEPKDYANSVVSGFQDAWELLNISNDHFIRTTDPRHEKIASEVLQKIYDKKLIYPGEYEGLYCVGCEKFLTEGDLINGKCPLHPNKEPVQQKEKNYFFKLSEFQDWLIEIFEKDEVKILPESRKNEVLGKLRLGLQDISVSRAGVSWGIPLPWDNSQTQYVWVEALLNYYTATQFLGDKERFWPADLHLIGKDILWFHCVIFPALLLAADIKLPKAVFAHGFFTINGQKMSKSLGNVISPKELVDRYGVDGARYLLLSAFPFGDDGDFSFEKLDTKFNAELANNLGNLVSRVAKLCETGNVDIGSQQPNSQHHLPFTEKHVENLEFDSVLQLATGYVDQVNKQIDKTRPWENIESKHHVLIELVDTIRQIAYEIRPFLPETAEKIEKQFKGPKIKSGKPLFPRIN